MTRVVALVPARNEADRIAETVRSLADLPCIGEVVVVDDASSDDTAGIASQAGARVLRRTHRSGKGGALEGALTRLNPADIWLFADADLAGSAGGLRPVLAAVLEGRTDLAIALVPRAQGGGFGLVRRAAAAAIRALTGFTLGQPLSGQRAIVGEALAACRPLAAGFGVETGMILDVLRAGFRVLEVPAPGVTHRPTGRTLRGFVHRGRQGWDIARAVAGRALRAR